MEMSRRNAQPDEPGEDDKRHDSGFQDLDVIRDLSPDGCCQADAGRRRRFGKLSHGGGRS
jgi:hypothetical protein